MVKVSLVRCTDYGHTEQCIKKALDLIGGIENFVKPKDKVLLKVNLLGPKPPSAAMTTHPKIVEAVMKILHPLDCEVWVGDSSGGRGLTEKSLQVSGIKSVAERLGGKTINFDKAGMYEITVPKGKILHEVYVAKPLLDADVVVSLPKLKTHALTLYTGAIKNMYGTIPGGRKSKIHGITGSSAEQFSEALIDIFSVVPGHLAIMDGIVGMEGLGPNMGRPKKSNVILASQDFVAIDSVSSALIGFKPHDIPMLRIAGERGLGTVDLEKIDIAGETIENVATEYKKPVRIHKGLMFLPAFIRNIFVETPRLPFAIKDKCTQCMTCQDNCPVDAIKVSEVPVFDYQKCIQCYCCHEICPESAIGLKKSLLQRSSFRK
jgi:uncharacterized protein (DUF362 family)/NAD-dependent dihydropyrimidine dehydrogenase PreA subunit